MANDRKEDEVLRKNILAVFGDTDSFESRKLERMKSLKLIKTARGMPSIKKAKEEGFTILMQKVQASEKIYVNPRYVNNMFSTTRDHHFKTTPDDDSGRRYYPYSFSHDAAYLLPDDLEIGERVILDDLIEDMVGFSIPAKFSYRLASAEAVWDGEKFSIVDISSYAIGTVYG